MQSELQQLRLWCHYNLLEVNASKTKVMFFYCKVPKLNFQTKKKLKFGGTELDYVDEYKY